MLLPESKRHKSLPALGTLQCFRVQFWGTLALVVSALLWRQQVFTEASRRLESSAGRSRQLRRFTSAHRGSYGRLVEIAAKSGGAKCDWRAIPRQAEGRHDSSAPLDGDGSRRGSGIGVGAPSKCAFHSHQRGDGSTMVQSLNHDDLLERDDRLSLEISRPIGRDS